jgi:hypothetical protein
LIEMADAMGPVDEAEVGQKRHGDGGKSEEAAARANGRAKRCGRMLRIRSGTGGRAGL